MVDPKLVRHQVGVIAKYPHMFFGGFKFDGHETRSQEGFPYPFGFIFYFASAWKLSGEPLWSVGSFGERGHSRCKVVALGEHHEVSKNASRSDLRLLVGVRRFSRTPLMLLPLMMASMSLGHVTFKEVSNVALSHN